MCVYIYVDFTSIMENQMKKTMENEMQTSVYRVEIANCSWFVGLHIDTTILGLYIDTRFFKRVQFRELSAWA